MRSCAITDDGRLGMGGTGRMGLIFLLVYDGVGQF